jgi:5-methylcytosine-specific restriction endonuclease McrA
MTDKDKRFSVSRHEQIVAEARLHREQREKSYREQALKMFPWVCGRCAREFTHSNLRELTVHHKDHNHDNNPENGSNWELLCIYCHDNEHSRYIEQGRSGASASSPRELDATFKPFASLNDLLKK